MKNKINLNWLLLLLAVLSASCNKDFLDKPPLDATVDKNFYQTSDQILAGTAPLYNVVWFAYNDKASHGIGDARGGVLTTGSYQLENVQFNTTGTTGENANAWKSFYNVVGQSNTLINNIKAYAGPQVPEAIKQHGIAEARFMRGLAYSYLTMNWGAVPIITDNASLLQDTSITRNTVYSVWQFIIKDMRFAANNLPEQSLQKGRLNKWAAEGMLAKMYLTRAGVTESGTPNGRRQSDLDSAAYYAKSVIDNSGAKLLENFEDLFLMKNNNNSESLFALQWVYNHQNYSQYGVQNSVQSYLAFGSSITGTPDGWGGDIGASYWLINSFDQNKDKRRKATFMFPGDHYSYIHQEVDDPNNAGKKIIQELIVPTGKNTYKVGGIEQKDVQSNGRAWIKKYVVGRPEDNDGKVVQQGTEINTYMLRLADVYLIYAEAILDKNMVDAVTYYNLVRKRAGLDEKATITKDDILAERILEFAVEGQLWYDYVRLWYYSPLEAYTKLSDQERGTYYIIPNKAVDPTSWTFVLADDQSKKYPVTSANFLLPIPSVEMSRAPNLRKEPIPYDFSKMK